MATGFKSATVNASDVPSSQTDFPAYVDLSRLGITTQAEADSVRCYSDESKTTELAREIVSTSEMHVKIPSLTSTFTLYVDWDGSRSDYAVGATYGRNNVWSDYAAVYHLQSSASDSTGNETAGSITGATNQAEKIENGYDFDGTNDKIDFGTGSFVKSQTQVTQQMWMRIDVINSLQQIWGTNDIGGSNSWQGYINSVNSQIFMAAKSINNRAVYDVSGLSLGTRYMFHVVYDGDGSTNADKFKIYNNGANDTGNTSYAGTVETTSTDSSSNLVWGERSGGSGDWNGGLDELRYRNSALTSNWITTEYNNQNDEATFWGTWSDAGGGGETFTPKVTIF